MKAIVRRLLYVSLVFLAACIEQRALTQFNAVVDRVCVMKASVVTIDQHLHTHQQGCVLITLEHPLAAGLSETGMVPGVYNTQATSLGFSQYLDEVILARTANTLAVMTPAAFRELAQAAAAVHEAHLEEKQLQEGLGLVLLGRLGTFTPAVARQLTADEIVLLRKAL